MSASNCFNVLDDLAVIISFVLPLPLSYSMPKGYHRRSPLKCGRLLEVANVFLSAIITRSQDDVAVHSTVSSPLENAGLSLRIMVPRINLFLLLEVFSPDFIMKSGTR